MKLNYIIINKYDAEEGDEEFTNEDRLRSIAQRKGWDASEAEVEAIDPSMIGQHFNSNCALKAVDEPVELRPEYISCLVLSDEEVWQ